MKRNERTGRPLILTVKREEGGGAEFRISEDSEHFDTMSHIRQGLAEAKRGLGRSPDVVFDEIAEKS